MAPLKHSSLLMLAQANDVECPINCWKWRALIPVSLFSPTFCLFWQVRDISVDILIKASNRYDDCSASRRGRFSSEGSRVFIAEEAAESKAPSSLQPTSFCSSLELSVWFWNRYPNTSSYKNGLLHLGELSCCSANDIQCDEREYRNISTSKIIFNYLMLTR